MLTLGKGPANRVKLVTLVQSFLSHLEEAVYKVKEARAGDQRWGPEKLFFGDI